MFNRNNLGAVILLALGLLIGAWLGAVFGARFALRRGGYTGDCLGAAQQLGELTFYLVLAGVGA